MRPLPPRLQDHFDDPRHVGRLDPPAVCGRGGNAACGDDLRVWVRVEAGAIREVAFQARACSAVIAVASLVVERLPGLELAAARRLDPQALVEEAGGLSGPRQHAWRVVRRALDEALEASDRGAA